MSLGVRSEESVSQSPSKLPVEKKVLFSCKSSESLLAQDYCPLLDGSKYDKRHLTIHAKNPNRFLNAFNIDAIIKIRGISKQNYVAQLKMDL